MVNDNIISHTPKKKGSKTFYYLTQNGKRFSQLNKINMAKNKHLFQKILEEIFLSEIKNNALLFWKKEEFEEFLKECGIQMEKLIWSRPVTTGSNQQIVDLLYGQKTSNQLSKDWKKFWNENKSPIIFEDINWICIPIQIEEYLVHISRTEHWQISTKNGNVLYSNTYRIDLPGIHYDPSQIKNRVEQNEINKIINYFKEYDIIKIISIGKYQRIMISDKRLYGLIEEIVILLDTEFSFLDFYWSLYQKPSNKDIQRFEYLMGKSETKAYFRKLSILRSTENKIRKKYQNVEKHTIDSKKIIFQNIKKDDYCRMVSKNFLNSLLYKYLQEIYPIILSDFEEHVLDTIYMNPDEKNSYINTIPKIKISKDYLTYDIFDNYLRSYIDSYMFEDIKKLKIHLDSNIKKTQRTIKKISYRIVQLENFLDISHFVGYVKKTYYYEYHDILDKVYDIREMYNNLFEQYDYLLNKTFENIFPILSTKLQSMKKY